MSKSVGESIYPHCLSSLAPMLSMKAVPGAAGKTKRGGVKKIENKANFNLGNVL